MAPGNPGYDVSDVRENHLSVIYRASTTYLHMTVLMYRGIAMTKERNKKRLKIMHNMLYQRRSLPPLLLSFSRNFPSIVEALVIKVCSHDPILSDPIHF